MNKRSTKKASKQAEHSAFSVRLSLDEILNEKELKSFKSEAEKAGRTIREHFLALTFGDKKSA